MSQMSNYLENSLINHVLRATALPSPTTVYVALYTSDPTDADTGTEVTGGAYTRQAVTFGAPSNGVATNSAQVTFPVATANWGLVTHIGIRDAATVGNLIVYGPLSTSKQIDNGDQFIIKTSNLSITFA